MRLPPVHEGPAELDLVAGELAGLQAAAEPVAGFEQEDGVAGAPELARGREASDPASDDDRININGMVGAPS